jgi:hypothetical protein
MSAATCGNTKESPGYRSAHSGYGLLFGLFGQEARGLDRRDPQSALASRREYRLLARRRRAGVFRLPERTRPLKKSRDRLELKNRFEVRARRIFWLEPRDPAVHEPPFLKPQPSLSQIGGRLNCALALAAAQGRNKLPDRGRRMNAQQWKTDDFAGYAEPIAEHDRGATASRPPSLSHINLGAPT